MGEPVNNETRPSQLRMLAKDYADGRIQRKDYLRQRTAFLDALASQSPRCAIPLKGATQRLTAASAPVLGTPPVSKSPRRKGQRRTMLVMTLGIGLTGLLGAGVGLLLLGGKEPTQAVYPQAAGALDAASAPGAGVVIPGTRVGDNQAEIAEVIDPTATDIADGVESAPESTGSGATDVFAHDLGIDVGAPDLEVEHIEGRPADQTTVCASGDACPPTSDTVSASTSTADATAEEPAPVTHAQAPDSAVIGTSAAPNGDAEQAGADRGVARDSVTEATAAPSERTPKPERRLTGRLPALELRLPAADRSDVCALAATRLDDPETPTYGCRDRFLHPDPGEEAPMLAVIPGSHAPFAITAKPTTLATLQEWWCLHQRLRCAGATVVGVQEQDADETQSRAQRPAQVPDNAEALALDYASWLREQTGYQYRVATQAELIEAARYGFETENGIRLVRQLTLTQGSTEAQALARWWHYHLARSP